MLKVLSLFSGYGTDVFALKKLGIQHEIVGFSDIDKYANQCFTQNHCKYHIGCSSTRIYEEDLELGNIKDINPNELPDFDLLTGGFPCQSFSVAGKGLGELDPRGTLFYEIIRIAEVKKPQYMLLENVKGLTCKKHKATFEKILSELDRIGYHVDWKVLNTKDYGIPQNRERVFFVCLRKDFFKGDGFPWPEKEELKIFIKDILEPEPVDKKYYLKSNQVEKLLDGISKKMSFKERVLQNDEISSKKSARDFKEPKCIQIDKVNLNGHQSGDVHNSEGIMSTLNAVNYKEPPKIYSVQWDQSGKGYNSQEDRAYNVDGIMCCIPNANPGNKVNIFKVEPKDELIKVSMDNVNQQNRIYDSEGVSPSLNTNGSPKVFASRSYPRNGTKEIDGERFQNPEFREDGCSNSLTSVEKDNLLCINPYNGKTSETESGTIGTSVGTNTGKTAQILMINSTQEHNSVITDGISGSLPSAMGEGGGHIPMVGDSKFIDTYNHCAKDVCPTLTDPCHNSLRLYHQGIFRRLTPKECFRLQGFLNDEINLEGLSDTQKYKLCGNGQSVNVVAKIFEKMFNNSPSVKLNDESQKSLITSNVGLGSEVI